MTDLSHGSELSRTLHEVALYPPHPPRTATARYTKTHHKLVVQEDQPCLVCGVRNSTLGDPAQNPWGATQIETHHRLVEDSLANAIDVEKFNRKVLPALLRKTGDQAKYGHPFTQEEMVDWIHGDEDNMWCLCLAPETPVLMADGTQRPIADVRIGNDITGPDGMPHRVTGTVSREHTGPIYDIDGVRMTDNHPVLTPGGWVRADQLTVGQIVYELGVLTPEMSGLTLEQDQVFGSVVGPDTVHMVHPLLTGQSTPDQPLHHVSVLHDGAPATAILVPDHTPDVAPLGHVTRTQPCGSGARQFIESREPACVGAEAPQTALDVERLGSEGAVTTLTGLNDLPPLEVGSTLPGASRRTSRIARGDRRNNEEVPATGETELRDSVSAVSYYGRWRAIEQIHVEHSSLIVYDIAVEGCRSFVAGSLAVHNCDVHHRHPLVGIHAITGPIWGVQDLLLDGYDLTGFHPASPQDATAINHLPVVAKSS